MRNLSRSSLLWMLLGFNYFIYHFGFIQCNEPANYPFRVVLIPGNITLGGLFPMFVPGNDGKCSVVNSALGIPLLEALLFSIDRINTNKSLLPNITLGVKAFDTCGNQMAALDRAVRGFVLGEDYTPGYQHHTETRHAVFGVVGPGYSYEAVHVSPFLGLFNIPLISYGATSPELSDKSKYEYFSRTLPHDSLQGKVIADVLEYFNWTYVSIVYSDEPYGRSGFNVITREARRRGICFAQKQKLPLKYKSSLYKAVVQKILRDKRAQVVVLFCIEEVILPFMTEVRGQIGSLKLQFIGSETLGMLRELGEIRNVAIGTLFTLPATDPVPAFNEYFFDLSVGNNPRNRWFSEFFQETANCSLDQNSTSRRVCNTSQTLRDINYVPKIEVFNSIPFVIDSVYTFAHALHVWQQRLNKTLICDIPGNELLKILRTTTYESPTGNIVNISNTGDITGEYRIYYLDKGQHGTYENIEIGEWRSKLEFSAELQNTRFFDVVSHCWPTCQPGEVRELGTGQASCCSTCVACPPAYFVMNETICQQCASGYLPDHKRRTCLALKVQYFTLDGDLVSFSLILPPIIISVIAIIALLFTTVIFLRHNNTPLVKASARELSALLLLGLFLFFLFPFFAVLKPSTFTCLLQLVFDSLPFTICLVSIAVKNNRTYRIFNPNRNFSAVLQLVNPRAQMAVSLPLILFQVLLLIFVIIFEFPYAKLLFPSPTTVHLVCVISKKQLYLAHLYNALLLLVCTYYAYKTRHMPRNFNEAKYIAFAMYGACVISLAFFVVSMTANESSDDTYRPTIICYRVTLTATFLFVSFFAPKLYIILWKPEENKRHLVTNVTSETIVPREIVQERVQNGMKTFCVSSEKIQKMNDKTTQTE